MARFGPQGQYQFYLNEEERERYRDRMYAAEPTTADAEFHYACIHISDPQPWKEKKNKNTRRPPAKRTSVAKKKKKPQKEKGVNEDGYPLEDCEYEASEARLVYRPPGYAEEADPASPHCLSCHLKPCITVAFHNDGRRFMFDEYFKKKMTIPAAQKSACVFLHKEYCKAIKRRYLKKLQPPKCITDVCEHYVDVLELTVGHSESGSDDSEMSGDSSEEEEFTLQDLMSDRAAKRKKAKVGKQRAKADAAEQKKTPSDSEIEVESSDEDEGVTLADLKKKKNATPPRLSFGEQVTQAIADVDYLLNCNDDEDETREEYDARKAKELEMAKPPPKIDYENLSLCSNSSEEENEFTS
jgi:hypothetical protein